MKKTKIVVVYSSHLSDWENSKFTNHVMETVGVKYNHVACYINHNKFSLSEIYNKALREYTAEDTIIVFCHNDIIFRTKNWGRLLLNKFNNSDYDILGVAGSTYLPESGMWWEDRTKMVGIVDHTDGTREWSSVYSPERKGQITPTVLIDGLFMAVDPTNLEHDFDEDFKGFHFYDLSFCFPNYLDGCNIGVTTDIRILHKSIGRTNEQWEENRKLFSEKYYMELPYSIPPEYDEFHIKLKDNPKVTVIIPTKNNLKYITNNINSWNDVVEYDNYEIIIADTGSEKSVIDNYNSFLSDKIKLVQYNYYNFAKINNDVVKNHVSDDTEIILFCNDDIILLNDVLSRCVQIYNDNKETVGTIGIRLHFGDSSIQHNGISLSIINNQLIISHKDIRKTNNYSTTVNYNSIGNTAGFLLIKREIFNRIGGFNENYIECLEDVELNLKCKLLGLNNITVSDAVAIHFESISRNKLSGGNERFMVDYDRLKVFIMENNINF